MLYLTRRLCQAPAMCQATVLFSVSIQTTRSNRNSRFFWRSHWGDTYPANSLITRFCASGWTMYDISPETSLARLAGGYVKHPDVLSAALRFIGFPLRYVGGTDVKSRQEVAMSVRPQWIPFLRRMRRGNPSVRQAGLEPDGRLLGGIAPDNATRHRYFVFTDPGSERKEPNGPNTDAPRWPMWQRLCLHRWLMPCASDARACSPV